MSVLIDQLRDLADVTGTIAVGAVPRHDGSKFVLTVLSTSDEIAGAYLSKSGNLSGLSNLVTARTNLGLGTAAVVNTGQAAGNVLVLAAAGLLDVPAGLRLNQTRINFDGGGNGTHYAQYDPNAYNGPSIRGQQGTRFTNAYGLDVKLGDYNAKVVSAGGYAGMPINVGDVPFGGSGSVITPGTSRPWIVPADCTITAIYVVADVSTSLSMGVTVNGTSISGSDPVTLTAASSGTKTTFTGWTLTLTKGDVVRAVLASNTAATWLGVTMLGLTR